MIQADIKEANKLVAMSILDDLASELDKGFIEDTFDICGHKWAMRTLQDHERSWSAGYTRTQSMNSMLVSMRAPMLAIGIRSIDGLPIPKFFQSQWEDESKDITEAARRVLESQNPYMMQYWFAERLFVWLSQRPPSFVEKLWEAWLSLEKKREDSEAAMGKSLSPDGT